MAQIKSWIPPEQMDPGVLEQAQDVAQLDFVFKHVAIMPDAHVGVGACVGTVVATQGAIVPAIVGVDIGCGVYWLQTRIWASDLDSHNMDDLRTSIERRISLGPGKGNEIILAEAEPSIGQLEQDAGDRLWFYDKLLPHWRHQVGSLGGGNHFVEVVADGQNRVGGFLHSGSRGIGNKIATQHISLAKRLSKERQIILPHADLAYFEEGTEEFENYIQDMNWAQSFAFENRCEMMRRLRESLNNDIQEVQVGYPPSIHHHHNFTQQETHFGEKLWVTRKGAVSAELGEFGLLPTAMGVPSHIVLGLGNPDSFCSAPHGAGRRMSRKRAHRELNFDKLVSQMSGVSWNPDPAFLDEAPDAYKSPDEVLVNSRELMTSRGLLQPLLNIKGA